MNHVSLHYGCEFAPATRFELDEIDLASGDWHEVTVTATEVEDGMNVSVVGSDMIQAFAADKNKKPGESATWEEGDWNGDLKFDRA